MKKIWLFIGRMNPPHKWHISVIKKALSENDEVLVLLWSSGIIDESNPLSFEQRKYLLNIIFWEDKNVKIDIIKDTKTDLQWVENISEIIKNNFWENTFLNIYGWDFQNDSAIIAMKQFENILWKNINYIPVDRFLEILEYKWEQFHISATNLRNALRNWDRDLVEKICNEELVGEILELFKNS
jgi:nicotinic acid mononucleotide adenylyltransferase